MFRSQQTVGHYLEDTSQQVAIGIAALMKCVTVNIMWKILHSRWAVVLQLEWSVLSEYHLENTSHDMDNEVGPVCL
jgi:hypothetical protein